MNTTPLSAYIDLHADVYISLTDCGEGQHRLSAMITSRSTNDPAYWWLLEPTFRVTLDGRPAVMRIMSHADNGLALPNRELRVPERLAPLNIPPQTHAAVDVGPLAAGAMSYVEFDFLLSDDVGASGPIAMLRMTQQFGIRRLDGAAWMEAEILLGYNPDGEGLVMTEPKYLAMCDFMEDGDPENEDFAADEYSGYLVEFVPGASGPCAHNWCLEAISDSTSA